MKARLTLGKNIGLGLRIIVSIYGLLLYLQCLLLCRAALSLCLMTTISCSDLPDSHELHK